MGNFWCNYCDMKLTKDSPRVRYQHFSGKNHQMNVKTYWEMVRNEQYSRLPKINQVDQFVLLRSTFRIPGLEQFLDSSEVEDNLDKAELPDPHYYYP